MSCKNLDMGLPIYISIYLMQKLDMRYLFIYLSISYKNLDMGSLFLSLSFSCKNLDMGLPIYISIYLSHAKIKYEISIIYIYIYICIYISIYVVQKFGHGITYLYIYPSISCKN